MWFIIVYCAICSACRCECRVRKMEEGGLQGRNFSRALLCVSRVCSFVSSSGHSIPFLPGQTNHCRTLWESSACSWALSVFSSYAHFRSLRNAVCLFSCFSAPLLPLAAVSKQLQLSTAYRCAAFTLMELPSHPGAHLQLPPLVHHGFISPPTQTSAVLVLQEQGWLPAAGQSCHPPPPPAPEPSIYSSAFTWPQRHLFLHPGVQL